MISLFMAFVVPSFTQISRSSNLSNAGQMLVDTLNLARQVASTQNRRVEVRIYQLASKANTRDLACRAVQLFIVQTSGSLKALTPIARFPEPVVISDSMTATLPNTASTTSPILGSNSDSSNTAILCPIPGASGYQYVSFYFLPTGETDLDPTKKWFVTLVLANDSIVANGLPSNYLTVQIDACSGKVALFRP